MDGEKFDEGNSGRDGVGFGVEALQALLEDRRVDAESSGLGFERVEELEEAAHVGELGWTEQRIAAERAPCAFDELGSGEAGALGGGSLEDGPDAGHALACFFRQTVSALDHEARDGVFLEVGIIDSREGVQVGE